MLDMGFQPQIDSVLARIPQGRQTLLFTATWPKEVQRLAATYLRPDAAMLFIGGAEQKLVANAAITQTFEQTDEAVETPPRCSRDTAATPPATSPRCSRDVAERWRP
mmetsp:Transcript_39443/g.127646  ORF Transcript_39443/g.127646 Transcript_39443/m.127646 type:complete len:107 (-) Transcript_39443:168-488(-)